MIVSLLRLTNNLFLTASRPNAILYDDEGTLQNERGWVNHHLPVFLFPNCDDYELFVAINWSIQHNWFCLGLNPNKKLLIQLEKDHESANQRERYEVYPGPDSRYARQYGLGPVLAKGNRECGQGRNGLRTRPGKIPGSCRTESISVSYSKKTTMYRTAVFN